MNKPFDTNLFQLFDEKLSFACVYCTLLLGMQGGWGCIGNGSIPSFCISVVHHTSCLGYKLFNPLWNTFIHTVCLMRRCATVKNHNSHFFNFFLTGFQKKIGPLK